MDAVYRMENPVQPYAWGSHTAIAELLGQPSPSAGPQAELWMGAHPKAPSRIRVGNNRISLDRFIAENPEAALGIPVAKRYGGRLPYLFKVLAAERPLSIQAHPSRKQAQAGFRRENIAGIALDAPHRNYRDDNHKPEILCAVSPFWALCGFRPEGEIRRNLSDYCPKFSNRILDGFDAKPSGRNWIQALFQKLMTLPPESRQQVLTEAADTAKKRGAMPEARWMARLATVYPGDVGILSPLFLNLIRLEPGQALFLPAGQLHAYLEGTGMELMANSDNVLRGGLTPKHVEVAELMRILDFEPRPLAPIVPVALAAGEFGYPADAAEFSLSVIRTGEGGGKYQSGEVQSAQVLLCFDGGGEVMWAEGSRRLSFGRGDAFFVPAAAGPYGIEGGAILYKAAVPATGHVAA